MYKNILKTIAIISLSSIMLVGCGNNNTQTEQPPVQQNNTQQSQEVQVQSQSSSSTKKPSGESSIIIDGKIDGYNSNVENSTSKTPQAEINDKNLNQTTIIEKTILAIQENKNSYSTSILFSYEALVNKNLQANPINEGKKISNSINLIFEKNNKNDSKLYGKGELSGDLIFKDSPNGKYEIERYLVNNKVYYTSQVKSSDSTIKEKWGEIGHNQSSYLHFDINKDNLYKYLSTATLEEEEKEYVFYIKANLKEFLSIFSMGFIENFLNSDTNLLKKDIDAKIYIDKSTFLPTVVIFNKAFNYEKVSLNHTSLSNISKIPITLDNTSIINNTELTKLTTKILFDFNQVSVRLEDSKIYQAKKGFIEDNFKYKTMMTKYNFKYIYNDEFLNKIQATFDSSSTNAIYCNGYDSGLEIELFKNGDSLGTLSMISYGEVRYFYGYKMNTQDRMTNIVNKDAYKFTKDGIEYVYINMDDEYGFLFNSNNQYDDDLKEILSYITFQ